MDYSNNQQEVSKTLPIDFQTNAHHKHNSFDTT